MSYFATTKCPKCGKEKQHHLGGLGFHGEEKTTCSYCGHTYSSVNNCLDMTPDRDLPPSRSKILASMSAQQSSNHLAGFSTEELEKELQRRRL